MLWRWRPDLMLLLISGLMLSTPAAAQSGTTSMGNKGDFYVIQEGDTLWDISSRFLGDPYEWPELWSFNEYITNPHWIYPGNRIYFNLGDALNPPSVGTEPRIEVAESLPPAPKVEPPLCDFPPKYAYTHKNMRLRAAGTIGDDDMLNIRGSVLASDIHGMTLAKFPDQAVFLKMSNTDDIECGTQLGVFRKPSKDKLKGASGTIGQVYIEVGLVEVVRVDDDVLTTKIITSYYEIERGDLVGDPIVAEYELDVRAPDASSALEAEVIGRINSEAYLTQARDTVFLGRGTADGIDVGASFFIVDDRDGIEILPSKNKSAMGLPEWVVGRIVVVRAEEDWSTAVVVDSARELHIGARAVTVPNAQ